MIGTITRWLLMVLAMLAGSQLVAAQIPTSSLSQPEPAATTVVEVGTSYESLGRLHAPWRSFHLSIERRQSSGRMLYGEFTTTSRFRQLDHSLTAGLLTPLSRKLDLTMEVNGSPTHRVAPAVSFDLALSVKLKRGLVITAGNRHSWYSNSDANLARAAIEKYRGPFRVAYTLFVSNSTHTGLAASHLLQGNYYYGEQTSSVGLGLSYGRELERLPGSLLETNVRSIDVNGRHWLRKTLAVAYTIGLHQQGRLYSRRGVSVGLRYRF